MDTKPNTQKQITNKGGAEINGVQFSFELLRIADKKPAPMGHLFLKVVLPFRSVCFSGTALIKTGTARDPEIFMNACKQLLSRIIANEPMLVESLPPFTEPTATN